MSLREEQCKKVCRILDDVLANRPTERDSLIVTTRNAFKALAETERQVLQDVQRKDGGMSMDDLISRQGLANLLVVAEDEDFITLEEYDKFCDLVSRVSSAQSFNKGLWVKQELAPQTLLFCSLCGCKKPQGVAGNFCPNCGAYMRGEDDELEDKRMSVCDDCEEADYWECYFCCAKCYEDYGECPNPDCDPWDI